jgi:hypothetical protein
MLRPVAHKSGTSAWAAQPDERGANHRARVAGVAAAGRRGKTEAHNTWLTATFGFKDRYSDQEIEAVRKGLDEAE